MASVSPALDACSWLLELEWGLSKHLLLIFPEGTALGSMPVPGSTVLIR